MSFHVLSMGRTARPAPQRRLGSALLTLLLATVGLFAAGLRTAQAAPPPSILDRHVNLPGFGDIAYRAPLPRHKGPTLVLVHGIFAGSTHRSFNELLPLLDSADARVYTLDLPGTGDSDSPKRAYNMALLDQFLASFLDRVVDEQAVVVAESLLGTTALKVAADHPDLVSHVVLLSPTGVVNLASPPSSDQSNLYNLAYGNDLFGFVFYSALLSDPSLHFFLERTFADKTLVTEALLDEYRLARGWLGQRWISFAFVGGQLYRKFADVAPAVKVPVLAVFGKQAQSPGPVGRADTADDFAAIRHDFSYHVLDAAGLNVQREQPAAVARLILDFAK